MTSREDRELGSMKILEEQVRLSVYTWTQLIEGGCKGGLHLDPAFLQFHQLATVLQALETTQDPKITLCAPVCSPSSQTGVTWNVAKGVTCGPNPAAAYFIKEKVLFNKKKRKLDYWIKGYVLIINVIFVHLST